MTNCIPVYYADNDLTLGVSNINLTDGTSGNIQFGTYLPTASGSVNVASIGVTVDFTYTMIGNIVHVSGYGDITATAGAPTLTEYFITVPPGLETTGTDGIGSGIRVNNTSRIKSDIIYTIVDDGGVKKIQGELAMSDTDAGFFIVDIDYPIV
jgi:hypothetical protein